MGKALKAALLSGLVLPGLGQIFLKRYRRGFVLMIAVLGGIVGMVAHGLQTSIDLMEKLETASGPVDLHALANAATQSSGGPMFDFVPILIVILWIFSILDAYRLGKAADAAAAESSGIGAHPRR